MYRFVRDQVEFRLFDFLKTLNNTFNMVNFLFKNVFLLLTLLPITISAQTFTRVGNPDDVDTDHKQGFLLMGGANDNFDGLEWFYALANVGDIVIIRYDTGTGYNTDFNDYPMNSITTIESINTITKANNPDVEEAIRNAEAVFIPGGNQWNYYNTWKGTKLHEALLYLINEKGGSVGGTSAGLAVLGEFLYTAQNNTVFSSEALENPYNHRMTIANDFLNIPILQSVITDSHFNRKESDGYDRQGRLFAFVGRIAKDWQRNPAMGIGVNEYTAVGIDEDGKGYVFGNPSYDDFAYFLVSDDCLPEACEDGTPLTWNCNERAVKVVIVKGKRTNPDYFDLNTWDDCSECSWEYWYSINGVLHKTDATTSAPFLSKTDDIINVYPNPASREIWVNGKDEMVKRVDIFSSTGELALTEKSEGFGEIQIKITHLPNGAYLVRMHTNSGVYTTRLIITR